MPSAGPAGKMTQGFKENTYPSGTKLGISVLPRVLI